MTELQENNKLRNPLISILLTLLIAVLGQFIGAFVGMEMTFAFYPGSRLEFNAAMSSPFSHPELKGSLLFMQGFGTLFGMIVLPLYFLKAQARSLSGLFQGKLYLQPAIIVPILVIVFMGVNSIFIEWNQNLHFPGDEWARSMEKNLAEATKFLTQFKTTSDLVLVFVVIAVLPAIGEEIVFRGMIQNDLYRATKNIHVAIWASAILFSAIHIQFFGFVPRMLLGAMFGYLYFWSGNLWLAVLAHFVNNGFTVIALYLYQKGLININLEETSATPWQAVIFSAIFTAALIYSYKNFYNHNPKSDIPD